MHRVHHLYVGEFIHDPADGPEHSVHRCAEIFPAVSSKHNEPRVLGPAENLVAIVLSHSGLKGVDSGITGNDNALVPLALGPQSLAVVGGQGAGKGGGGIAVDQDKIRLFLFYDLF